MWPLRVIVFIAGLGMLANCNCLKLCPEFETDVVKPPVFKFSTIKHRMNHNIVIREDRNEVLINRTKIFEVKLDCWASYPIDLTFSGHLTNQQVSVKNGVRSYLKSNGDKGHCFHINLTMETYEEITGNYSCFAVTNSSLKASKYIYVFSAPPGVLLKRGQNITVVAEPGKRFVVLPCAISNPDVQVQLHKLSIDKNDKNWIVPSTNLKFDPKIGYTMRIDQVDKAQYGKYECVTTASHMDLVNIDLVSSPEWKVEPKLRIIRLKIGDRLNLTCMAQEDVYISFKSNTEEEIITLKNSSTKPSLVYKFVANTNVAVEEKAKTGAGIAECLRRSDNTSLHTWQLIISNETRKHGVLEMSRIVDSCPKSDNSKNKVLVLYECNNWIECRINRCIMKDSTCQPSNRCQEWACNPHGIIQCVTPEGSTSEIYFTGFNGTRYTNGQLAPKDEVFRLGMPKLTNTLGSKSISLLCEGSSFVIASGFQWSLLLSNGSLIDLMHLDFGSSIKETWGQTKSILTSTLTLPETFCNRTDIKTVVCGAPLWNTTGWMNQSMEIHDILRFKQFYELEASTPTKGVGPSEPTNRGGQLFNPLMPLIYILVHLFRV